MYQLFEKEHNINFDVIINIQGDEPLLDIEQIRLLISCFNESATKMATLIIPVKKTESVVENKGVFVVIDKFKNALYFSRSVIPFVRDVDKIEWQKRHAFYKHIGMYGFTPAGLIEFSNLQQSALEIAESLEQNRWLENGNNIKVEITESQNIGVDTQEDLDRVRKIVEAKG